MNFPQFFPVIDEPDIPLRTPNDVINATIPIQESFYVIWTLFFIIFTEFFSELVPLGTISQKKFWYKKRQYHAKRVYRLEVRLDWIFCSKSYKLQFLFIFFYLKKVQVTNFIIFQSTILSSAFILINVTLAVSFTLLVRYLGHGEFVVPFCRALGKFFF